MDVGKNLNSKLLGRRWGLSHRTLERWRHDGIGPVFLKVGGRIVYRLEDILAFEGAQVCQPGRALDATRIGQGKR